MSDQVTLKLPSEEAATENDSERQLAPEMTEKHTYETDPFTVTADGTVVKGVETESPKQSEKETEQLQTDADGNVITPQTDENGSAITPQTDENGNVISSTDTGSGQEDTDWIPEAWTIAQAAQVKMIHPIATAEIPHGMTAAMKMVLEMGAAPEGRR